MRQVRTCDFCGDDASGLYEPLPDSIPDGPRLLLCDGCRDRLASVIDPLLDRVQADGGSVARPASTSDAGGDESGDKTTPVEPETSADAGASTASVSDSRDASGRSKRERRGTPHGYRKVLRFLENRELPVAREEAEQLAAEAYEMDTEGVAAVIDHAVEYGRLREVDGQLKR